MERTDGTSAGRQAHEASTGQDGIGTRAREAGALCAEGGAQPFDTAEDRRNAARPSAAVCGRHASAGTARPRRRWQAMALSLTAALCLALALACAACSAGTSENAGNDAAQTVSAAASDAEENAPVEVQDPDGLTPSERIDQVIAVAEQELGNQDGTVYEDALLDAGGELCYERGYWCATFIWWSFREAGMSDWFCDGQMIVYPQQQAEFYESKGRYHAGVGGDWQPERGDLMFFFYNDGFPGGERISHSEIVLSYDPETATVQTLSANPVVEYHQHSAYDPDARGFAEVDYENVPTSTLGTGSDEGAANGATPQSSENALVSVTDADGSSVTFQLNGSTAADSLLAQLPLTVEIEDYGANEKIFYPEALDTSDTPAADVEVGTLAYYEPWGDVVLFYGAYNENPSLYELGSVVSGMEDIEDLSGAVTVATV